MQIEGWNGSLLDLAEHLHRLDFKTLAQFYRDAENELGKQADRAATEGRTKAAQLLSHAAFEAHRLAADFNALISA